MHIYYYQIPLVNFQVNLLSKLSNLILIFLLKPFAHFIYFYLLLPSKDKKKLRNSQIARTAFHKTMEWRQLFLVLYCINRPWNEMSFLFWRAKHLNEITHTITNQYTAEISSGPSFLAFYWFIRPFFRASYTRSI